MQSTVLYWSQVSPSDRGVLYFGVVTLALASMAAITAIADALYARAERDGHPSGGSGVRLALLVGGPLLGSTLAAVLCGVAAAALAFIADLTGIPPGALAAVTVLAAAALLTLVVIRHVHQRQRLPLRLLVASVVAAALLTIGTVALLIVAAFSGLQSSSVHLRSAAYDGQRYHLAREDTFLERPTLRLYRCDALGLLCREVDSYGYHASVHGGLLLVNEYVGSVTAQAEDGHILFTASLGDGFAP